MRLGMLLVFAVGLVSSSEASRDKETFRLFFLGGQSNMEGHGLNSDLPEAMAAASEDVWIFHGNPTADDDRTGGLGKWDKLKPGNGAGFISDGVDNHHSQKFGVELSFGKKISELYPGEKIAIIKYARGGSSIDSQAAREFGSWEMDYLDNSGINQFDHFLNTLQGASNTRDIDGDGIEDILAPNGIIWMQGESDATLTADIANRYNSNLKRLMDLIRAAFLDDDLAVVIGKISDSGDGENGKVWRYGELVQHAQEEYVRNDKKAAIVRDTMKYQYSDPYHYDSEGYLDLGTKFAEAIFLLNARD